MSSLDRKYNLKRGIVTGDEKTFGIEHHTVNTAVLPSTFDLRMAFPNCVPPILDQFTLGSCASNEASNAIRFCLAKEKVSVYQPSRLFLYYFGRLFEGSNVNQDTGTSISGLCGSISKYGVCSEHNWDYDITKFTVQPPRIAIMAAHTHLHGYEFLQVPQDLIHMKQALVSGYPIIIGIQVYDSFESDIVAKTGIVPMPRATEKNLGGHAVSVISYNDVTQTFTCQNSWGVDGWGLPDSPGYFTIPYSYLLDPSLSGDFAQIRYFK